MTQVSRRSFIVQASLTGAAATAAGTPLAHAATEDRVSRLSHPEVLVVHVRDFATGEIALLADAEEVVVHDVGLVGSLLDALAGKGR
jgi:hypothetical protein